MTKTTNLLSELRHFIGHLQRYRHGFNRQVIYTPGVQYLAEEAEAYWLIDAIASHIGSPAFNAACQKDDRIKYLHYWCLEVTEDSKAVLRAMIESSEPPFAPKAFITQQIPFTDFPFREFNLWAGFDGTHWTIYLPSEH